MRSSRWENLLLVDVRLVPISWLIRLALMAAKFLSQIFLKDKAKYANSIQNKLALQTSISKIKVGFIIQGTTFGFLFSVLLKEMI